MRPILLVTVPHTATRFFADLLSEALHLPNERIRKTDTGYVCRYIGTMHFANVELMDRYIARHDPLLVTTVREEAKIRESWEKRIEQREKFGGGPIPLRSDIDLSLERWLDFVEKYDPLIVSVDSPEREAMLERLSEAVGVELETDWRPVGAFNARR
jgi:hypothetical protein